MIEAAHSLHGDCLTYPENPLFLKSDFARAKIKMKTTRNSG